MDILQSLILGAVEGVTEFLPVSSTGHLVLMSELLDVKQSDFVKSFEIIIQLGAICSVVFLYWRSFLNPEILKRLVTAFIPTGVIGLILYKAVKTYLIGNQAVVLWALLLGGIALVAFEFWHSKKSVSSETGEEAGSGIGEISYKKSLWIGLCQAIAIVPGVSRSAATIVGGLAAGLKRKTIVEFSFLLAVPTMAAATGLDLMKNAGSFSKDQFGVLAVGFIVSFFVAVLSIKFLLSFVKKHSFIPFGIYRVIIALLFWLIVFE